MTIIAYRSDHRLFKPNDIMTSAGDYLTNPDIPDDTRKAETEIRLGHYDRTRWREQALYTYFDETAGLGEWQTRGRGKRYLYKLSVEKEDLLHTGDLIAYATVIEDIRQKLDSTDNVKKYWDGCDPYKHAEYLVTKARVLELLRQPSDWKSHYQLSVERLRNEPGNAEFYENPTLNNLD